MDWPEFEALLPDGGFPRGSVVELTSSKVLGGPTWIALLAIRAALASDARAYSAWLDPYETLYAPGVARSGVDLRRLLVVRPPVSELGRIAVKVAASGAFEIVVVEMAKVPGAPEALGAPKRRVGRGRREIPPEVIVRKLALSAEKTGTTVLLLTDSDLPRRLPLPVALRLELARTPSELSVRVAKDRRGRMGPTQTSIPLRREEA